MLRGRKGILAGLTAILCTPQVSPQQVNQPLAASAVPDSQDAIESCQASHVSYSNAYSSTLRPRTVVVTRTITSTSTTLTYDLSFGQADVYTTISGFPHARGELSVASTLQTSK